MAAAPGWKVYDSFDTYQSSCKEVEAAAAVVTFYGPGSTIRTGHPKNCIMWTEGIDGIGASNYDQVTATIASRSMMCTLQKSEATS